jgi:tRNA-modifying protein YgfZ
MLKLAPYAHETIALPDLGVLRITGADAERFLQGQFSNDMKDLKSGHAMLAGYHNPQGRAIAILRLVRSAPEEVLAILPRELAAMVAGRLAKFILRAKVKIDDVSESLAVDGLVGAAEARTSLDDPGMVVPIAAEPARSLRIRASERTTGALANRQRWRRFDIADGLPQVYSATCEDFVAQMLNLDALGAIAFEKGCYTGQEVIARAHYRGRVKRRMQRFLTHASLELVPGTAGRLADGRSFKVVDAVRGADGSCEFLAVAAITARDEAQALADTALVEATPLPLPYPLPD